MTDPVFQSYHVFPARDDLGSVILQRYKVGGGIVQDECVSLSDAFSQVEGLEPQWVATPTPKGHSVLLYNGEVNMVTQDPLKVTQSQPTVIAPSVAAKHDAKVKLLDDTVVVSSPKGEQPAMFAVLQNPDSDHQLSVQVANEDELAWLLQEMASHYSVLEMRHAAMVQGSFTDGLGYEWEPADPVVGVSYELSPHMNVSELAEQATIAVDESTMPVFAPPVGEGHEVSEFLVTTEVEEFVYRDTAQSNGWIAVDDDDSNFQHSATNTFSNAVSWPSLCAQQAIPVPGVTRLRCQVIGLKVDQLRQKVATLEAKFSKALAAKARVQFDFPDQPVQRKPQTTTRPITRVLIVDPSTDRHVEIVPESGSVLGKEADPEVVREALRVLGADLFDAPKVEVLYEGYDYPVYFERELEAYNPALPYDVFDPEGNQIGAFASHNTAQQFLEKEVQPGVNQGTINFEGAFLEVKTNVKRTLVTR